MTHSYEYPRPSLTVDMVVVCPSAQSLLLIKRGGEPFKGHWALPGGHIEEGESADQAAARELAEEAGITGVKLQQMGTYTEPNRDPRGWTATIAYLGIVEQPVARAGDDAAEAKWFPIDQLPPLAFDHRRIVDEIFENIGL